MTPPLPTDPPGPQAVLFPVISIRGRKNSGRAHPGRRSGQQNPAPRSRTSNTPRSTSRTQFPGPPHRCAVCDRPADPAPAPSRPAVLPSRPDARTAAPPAHPERRPPGAGSPSWPGCCRRRSRRAAVLSGRRAAGSGPDTGAHRASWPLSCSAAGRRLLQHRAGPPWLAIASDHVLGGPCLPAAHTTGGRKDHVLDDRYATGCPSRSRPYCTVSRSSSTRALHRPHLSPPAHPPIGDLEPTPVVACVASATTLHPRCFADPGETPEPTELPQNPPSRAGFPIRPGVDANHGNTPSVPIR